MQISLLLSSYFGHTSEIYLFLNKFCTYYSQVGYLVFVEDLQEKNPPCCFFLHKTEQVNVPREQNHRTGKIHASHLSLITDPLLFVCGDC